jgi:enoyl-CoA hydratase
LRQEWTNGVGAVFKEGTGGAARFAGGKGRHGDFAKI